MPRAADLGRAEVVADDHGSSDGSGERLEAWAVHRPWMRVIHQPPEGLVSTAVVHQAVFSQFEAVIRQLLAWDKGETSFQSSEVPDLGAFLIDPVELLVVIGYDGLGPLVKGLVRLALKRTAAKTA